MYLYSQIADGLINKREHVCAKTITGRKSQMSYIRLEAGEETDHAHMNEQLGFILKGEVEITIENEKMVLGPGDAYVIPGNVRHGFKVVNGRSVDYLEIFTPPKEENK